MAAQRVQQQQPPPQPPQQQEQPLHPVGIRVRHSFLFFSSSID